MGLWRLAKTAVLSFSTFPLSVFYFIGLTALVLFVSLAGFSLYCRLFTELAIPRLDVAHPQRRILRRALNALGISILGEYVVRIYDQVRERPIYLVDRKVNFREADRAASLQVVDLAHEVEGDPYEELLEEANALLNAAGTEAAADEQPLLTTPALLDGEPAE